MPVGSSGYRWKSGLRCSATWSRGLFRVLPSVPGARTVVIVQVVVAIAPHETLVLVATTKLVQHAQLFLGSLALERRGLFMHLVQEIAKRHDKPIALVFIPCFDIQGPRGRHEGETLGRVGGRHEPRAPRALKHGRRVPFLDELDLIQLQRVAASSEPRDFAKPIDKHAGLVRSTFASIFPDTERLHAFHDGEFHLLRHASRVVAREVDQELKTALEPLALARGLGLEIQRPRGRDDRERTAGFGHHERVFVQGPRQDTRRGTRRDADDTRERNGVLGFHALLAHGRRRGHAVGREMRGVRQEFRRPPERIAVFDTERRGMWFPFAPKLYDRRAGDTLERDAILGHFALQGQLESLLVCHARVSVALYVGTNDPLDRERCAHGQAMVQASVVHEREKVGCPLGRSDFKLERDKEATHVPFRRTRTRDTARDAHIGRQSPWKPREKRVHGVLWAGDTVSTTRSRSVRPARVACIGSGRRGVVSCRHVHGQSPARRARAARRRGRGRRVQRRRRARGSVWKDTVTGVTCDMHDGVLCGRTDRGRVRQLDTRRARDVLVLVLDSRARLGHPMGGPARHGTMTLRPLGVLRVVFFMEKGQEFRRRGRCKVRLGRFRAAT
ncbi:hypothetical protein PsorP6_011763 [Peronosclerospora sorghi]|uniref:Uncharacterized protein n=1 Tax=Peronosclerospora sorghi TaxID=230839 RepID=A0ACC0WI42_9STRA|nr:hypothetical protein PsorP6_011763 [Peronosclerospora sorghi]